MPHLRLEREATDPATGVRRLELAMHVEGACWGVLNVTGPLAAWSFTGGLAPAPIPVRTAAGGGRMPGKG